MNNPIADTELVNRTKRRDLMDSNQMTPVEGTVDISIPVDVLWEFFAQPYLWPDWNPCFFWVMNQTLEAGKQLIWAFQPIRRWYLYKMPAMAKIVELREKRRVTWEVSALPGFYALHAYSVEPTGKNRCRFGSWEKAMGWGFGLMKPFWLAHFRFVRDASLAGAGSLERRYRSQGILSPEMV